MSYKFMFNIYDPYRPDAVEKILSKNYGVRNSRRRIGTEDQTDIDGFIVASKISPPPSPERVLNYIKNIWLVNKKLGLPISPDNSELTQEDLITMGYKGVYVPIYPPNRRASPSCGTGTGIPLYPKIVRVDKQGNTIEIIKNDHTVL